MNDCLPVADELLGAHVDQLFRYCWSMLRSREIAQIALCDALLAAQAHIVRHTGPKDPGSVGTWLYSLARAECRRHRAAPAADADEAPAGSDDAGPRRLAWNAAMSLKDGEFEALELVSRHGMDPASVLGLPAGEARALLVRARRSLERALGAEILVRRGRACPGLARVLAEVPEGAKGAKGAAPVTAEVRERVVDHAASCAVCAGNWPRNVSAARVFALLPAPALPPSARAELLGDPAGPGRPADRRAHHDGFGLRLGRAGGPRRPPRPGRGPGGPKLER